MKIAVDCRMINCSGIGTFLTGILSELLSNQKFEFLLVGDTSQISRKLDMTKFKSAIEYLDVKIPIFSPKEMFCFPAKRINKCDCFFTPNFNIPFNINIPIISTIHDVLFLDYPELAGTMGTYIRKSWMNWAIKKSHTILTVSNFSKERIISFFPKTASKLIVCGNGVKESLKNEHNSSYIKRNDTPYFLYLGNVKPHKGLDILLRAYREYRKNGGINKLKIVGEYQNFKTHLNLESLPKDILGIDFTGRVSDEKLINLLQEAECLIQPSLYEGFGIPPLEAMYVGTPVILSDIPVFRELYHEFPVCFFKSGDSNDLFSKMLLTHNRINLDGKLADKYSYSKVASIISDLIFNI